MKKLRIFFAFLGIFFLLFIGCVIVRILGILVFLDGFSGMLLSNMFCHGGFSAEAEFDVSKYQRMNIRWIVDAHAFLQRWFLQI